MTVTVFLCDGTHNLFDWLGGAVIPVPDNPLIPITLPALINTNYCTLQAITWADALLPLRESVNDGVSNLSATIASCGTNFILAGYSQGAVVCSLVLRQLMSGSLQSHYPQFLGATMFGNPCRKKGDVAPVQDNPGGHGLWGNNLLTATPDSWWEFAMPLDFATTVPDSVFGTDVCTIAEAIFGDCTGGSIITFILQNLGSSIQIDIRAVGDLLLFLGHLCGLVPSIPGMLSADPHGMYYNTAPPGASQTCAALAASYINQLIGAP